MITRITHSSRHLLVRLTDSVGRGALAVILAFLVASVGAVFYISNRIAISTDTSDMLSSDLPFMRTWTEKVKAFPQLDNTFVVVIEGETADLADDAALAIADGMRQRPDLFSVVFDPVGDRFFRRNGLLYSEVDELNQLANRLAAAQPFLAALSADQSLRGLFELLSLALQYSGQAQQQGALDVGPVLDAIAEVVEAQAQGRPAVLSWHRLFTGEQTPKPGENPRLIVVKPVMDFTSLHPGEAAMNGVRAIAGDLGWDEEQGIELRLTGEVALQGDELNSVMRGMEIAGLLSLSLVLGLLVLCFRSLWFSAATLITLIIGLILTSGFAVWAVGALNVISVAFAVLFIGLGVDFGIHYVLRYRDALRDGVAHQAALRQTVRGLGGALTLSATAAAIGFFSFLPTDYSGLAELGLIAGTGMAVALVTSLTLLPALLSVFPANRPPKRGVFLALSQGFREWTRRWARWIVGGALVVGVAATALTPFARFDFDFLNLKDPDSESVATLRALLDAGDNGGYELSVIAENLQAAQAVGERVSDLEPVGGTLTLADFVPGDQQDKLLIIESIALFVEPALTAAKRPAPTTQEIRTALDALEAELRQAATQGTPVAEPARRLLEALSSLADAGDASTLADLDRRVMRGLPGRLAALKESLAAEPVSLDSLPVDLRDRWISEDGRALVEILPRHTIHNDAEALEFFVDSVRKVEPAVAGLPVTMLEAGRTIVRSFIEAALLAIVLTALLLAVLLKNFRELLLVFAPLVLAAVLTVASTVVLNVPFNFANVIVLPLLFGLGVAGALQFVVRERKEGGRGGAMNSSTPRAVVFSALTTIGSFGSLALSSHPGTASMGFLLAVALTFTVVCTLLVLPALMAWFRPAASTP